MSRARGILLGPDGDLLVVNGKAVVGNTTLQNQRLLLLHEKCELRFAPFDTVGLRTYLNDESPRDAQTEIRKVYARDRLIIESIRGNAVGELKIIAEYAPNA